MTVDELRALREAATDGPWEVDGSEMFPLVRTKNPMPVNRPIIAEVAEYGEPVAAQNARLIALAPTLADLVVEMAEALAVIAERRVPTTFGGGHGAAVNYARAALAKLAEVEA